MCRCHIFRKAREPASANNARRGTERQNHINQGPFIIQQGAKSLAEPCAECNESDGLCVLSSQSCHVCYFMKKHRKWPLGSRFEMSQRGVYTCLCLCAYVRVCESVCLCVRLFVRVFGCLFLYACMSVCLSLCVCPCVCLSVRMYDMGALVPLRVRECGGELDSCIEQLSLQAA